MKKPVVILISGKQGAGKSTLATALQQSIAGEPWGGVVGVRKFADPLYRMHHLVRMVLKECDSDNLPDDQIDGPLLQLLGTEWGRKTRSEDIWAKAAYNSLNNYLGNRETDYREFSIFDDARFQNEMEIFDKEFVVVKIRLVAFEHCREQRAAKWRPATGHPSEVGLDQYNGFDLTLDTSFMEKHRTLEMALAVVKDRVQNAKA